MKMTHGRSFWAASALSTCSKNRLKVNSPGRLLFGQNMILPIKDKIALELIHQSKQMQINKDNVRENIKRVDYNYKVIESVMPNNHSA